MAIQTIDREWSGTAWAIIAIAGASGKESVLGSAYQDNAKAHPYLLPSLLTTLLGTSNKQFGQYQFMISSVQHLGQRI